jgi:hypothetical protein
VLGVLGRREVGTTTDEDAEHGRSELPQRAVAQFVLHSMTVGGVERNGLISSHS